MKLKKLFSAILSLALVFSVFAAPVNAFAAEETYEIRLDGSNYNGYFLMAWDKPPVGGSQQTMNSGGSITVPANSEITVNADKEFKVIADGAVNIGTIEPGGEGGYQIKITGFTKDTTIIVNDKNFIDNVKLNVDMDKIPELKEGEREIPTFTAGALPISFDCDNLEDIGVDWGVKLAEIPSESEYYSSSMPYDDYLDEIDYYNSTYGLVPLALVMENENYTINSNDTYLFLAFVIVDSNYHFGGLSGEEYKGTVECNRPIECKLVDGRDALAVGIKLGTLAEMGQNSTTTPTETAPAVSGEHLWGYNTQFDAAAHWDHCHVCGAKNTPVAHSDADGNGFCVCGWPMASAPSRANPDTGVTADMLK